MIHEADVVVVGAGAFGCTAAYYLARRGLRVALLDRYEAGSQTSPRAAGLFKLIQASAAHTQLKQRAIRNVERFSEETGVALPFVRSGSVMAARTPEHAALIRREVADSLAWGVEVALVDAAEAQRLCPFLEAEGLLAAAYTPGDIYVEEPRFLLEAYLAAARQLGVEVLPHTPLTGIVVRDGEVTAVETSRGTIATPLVVDAAGSWARQVARLAAAEVPVVPTRHQLFISDPIAGVAPEYPIVRLIDVAVYLRPARGGLMLGGFEADPLPLDPTERPGFTMADVPLDMRVLDAQTASVGRQVPALQDLTIQEHRGGLFTMTADGRFVVGPVPGPRGLWAATGCNGSGFSSAPGIGEVLAEWIVDGGPSIDLALFDPGRFAETLDEDALRAACVWQYSHYYDPHSAA
jgi:glycine/D-amino acid oxidase-like deaminating enzyme